jgi:hypothetical protein
MRTTSITWIVAILAVLLSLGAVGVQYATIRATDSHYARLYDIHVRAAQGWGCYDEGLQQPCPMRAQPMRLGR